MMVPGPDDSRDSIEYGAVKLSVKPQINMVEGMVREFFARFGLNTDDRIRDYNRFYDIYTGANSPAGKNEILRWTNHYNENTDIPQQLNRWSKPGNWEVELRIPYWFVVILEVYGAKFDIITTEKKVVAQGYTPPEYPWIYPSEIEAGDIFGVSGGTLNSAVIRAVTGKIAHLGITDGNGNFYEALSAGMSISNILQIRKGGGDLIRFYRVNTTSMVKLKAVERAKYRADNQHRYKYSLGKALQAGCRSDTGYYICGYLNYEGAILNFAAGQPFSPNAGKFITGGWGDADQADMEKEPREFCSEAVYNCYFEAGFNILPPTMARFAYPDTIEHAFSTTCYGQLPPFVDLDNKIKVNT